MSSDSAICGLDGSSPTRGASKGRTGAKRTEGASRAPSILYPTRFEFGGARSGRSRQQNFPESCRIDGKTVAIRVRAGATVHHMSWLTILAVVAAAVAAIQLNIVLLNRASSSNDPVGKLGPIAQLPAPGLRPAPPGIIQPSPGPGRGEGRDD